MRLSGPHRKKLPKKRKSHTVEARVGWLKMFMTFGEYDDGTLGEIFIDAKKPGSTLQGLLNCLSIAVSLGLQHGVPLAKYTAALTGQRFEPHDLDSTSPIDMVFKIAKKEYGK